MAPAAAGGWVDAPRGSDASLNPAAPLPLPTPPGTTEIVSVGADGRQADGASGGVTDLLARANGDQAISADGRWVAFVSAAANLTPGTDRLPGGLYLRDRKSGTTVAVPWVDGRAFPAGVTAAEPAISSDGAVVAFTGITSPGTATIVATRSAAPFVLAWDRQTNLTELVSVDAAGRPTPGFQPSVSGDGRYVAYTRWFVDSTPPALSNLRLDGTPVGGQYYIYGQGAVCTPYSATVTVTVTDPDDPVASVTLHYQPNGGNVHSKPMASQGSNAWRATIDGADAANSGRITYWVDASDSHGNVSSPLYNSGSYLLNKGDCIL